MSVKTHLLTQDAGLKIASGIAGAGVLVAGLFFNGFSAFFKLVAVSIPLLHNLLH